MRRPGIGGREGYRVVCVYVQGTTECGIFCTYMLDSGRVQRCLGIGPITLIISDVHAVRATGISNIYRITPLPQPLILMEYGVYIYIYIFFFPFMTLN